MNLTCFTFEISQFIAEINIDITIYLSIVKRLPCLYILNFNIIKRIVRIGNTTILLIITQEKNETLITKRVFYFVLFKLSSSKCLHVFPEIAVLIFFQRCDKKDGSLTAPSLLCIMFMKLLLAW